MARGKKKEKELTLEEKLQEALVPEDEHPYEVPENWCWVVLEAVCNGFQYGYTEKASYDKIGPHFIRITDIGNGIIDDTSAPYCTISDNDYTKYRIHKGDIFIARMGSVGENGLAINDIDGVFASYLIRLVPRISPAFVRDFLQSPMYWRQITDKSQGTTRLNVNANVLRKLLFPLPPLPEQQRIVFHIERLFAKLDEAKEKAQAVVDGFEDRKAAILHKAFTGELTERWRTTHGIPFVINNRTLKELCTKITDGFHNSPKPVESGYPYVMAGSVREEGIDYYNGLYVDEKNHRELFNKAHPERGDILIVNIGASTGRAAVIDTDIEFSFKNSAILKIDKTKANPYYILFFIWLMRDYWLKEITRGGAQPFLSLKMLNDIEVPMVDCLEQNEVVAILNNFFKKEQQIKEIGKQVIDRIDTLKKSLLARAFRGGLGTNNPNDESAEELLKTIM